MNGSVQTQQETISISSKEQQPVIGHGSDPFQASIIKNLTVVIAVAASGCCGLLIELLSWDTL
jgi:hypothetical protein